MRKERNIKQKRPLRVKQGFMHVNIHLIVLIIIVQMTVYFMK